MTVMTAAEIREIRDNCECHTDAKNAIVRQAFACPTGFGFSCAYENGIDTLLDAVLESMRVHVTSDATSWQDFTVDLTFLPLRDVELLSASYESAIHPGTVLRLRKSFLCFYDADLTEKFCVLPYWTAMSAANSLAEKLIELGYKVEFGEWSNDSAVAGLRRSMRVDCKQVEKTFDTEKNVAEVTSDYTEKKAAEALRAFGHASRSHRSARRHNSSYGDVFPGGYA